MNRRHMSGDHHGRTARRATALVRAADEILGTHRSSATSRHVLWRVSGPALEWRKRLSRPAGSVKSRCSMFAGPASEYVGSHFWPSPSATSSRCSALWSHGKLAHLGGQRSRTWSGRCCVRYSVDVRYQPMTLADLARLVAAEADFDAQWRLVVEFLKEYHQEPAGVRLGLLEDTPGPVGDERWDVLFAGLAEHLAMRDGQAAPGWSVTRGLRRFWFPFDTPGARAQALVHAPAAFRRRGVFVADYEIDAA